MSTLSLDLPHDLVSQLTAVMDEKELSKVAERSFKRELEERAILERVNRTTPLVEKVLAEKDELMKMSHEEAVERMKSTLDKIHDQVCAHEGRS